MMHRSSRPSPAHFDKGSISAFVVVMTLIVIVCAGLAVDGARIIGTKVGAADHAENAARLAAQEVASVHGGELALDPGRASAAANSYLSSHGLSGFVTATPEQVTVTVSQTVNMTLLGLVGISTKTVTATRSSAPASQ
jgi:hypothetical protein